MRARKHRRILVIARGHIGDLIQATPALRALREHFPEARIAVLVNEYAADVLTGCPYVDDVVPAFAYHRRSQWAKVRDVVALAARLVGRFDTVIGLRYSPPPWPALALAIGARTRVGFDQPRPWGRLLTKKAEKPPKDLPNRLRNLRPLEAIGVTASPSYPPLTWGGPVVAGRVDELLTSTGLGGAPFATLQVSCDWGCNELDSGKWAAVIDGLATRHGMRAAVIGLENPHELGKFEEIRARTTHPPVSLHGRTTLPELFEVVRRSDLVVATDSALTQVALAQRVPAVIMFGIEPVEPNGPLPEERALMDVIQHWEGPGKAPTPNPHCAFYSSFCHSEHCRENSSLAQMTAEEILEHIDATLTRARASATPRP
jgi:ADP-heptose:LPS heptosyltransferase